jgi:hypothetical protein
LLSKIPILPPWVANTLLSNKLSFLEPFALLTSASEEQG